MRFLMFADTTQSSMIPNIYIHEHVLQITMRYFERTWVVLVIEFQ